MGRSDDDEQVEEQEEHRGVWGGADEEAKYSRGYEEQKDRQK